MSISVLFQRTLSALRAFYKSLSRAVVNYLRSKTKQFPERGIPGRREVIGPILEARRTQETLQKISHESGIPLDQVEATFRRYLLEIAADLNYLVYPIWDFLLTWTFDTLYEGLDVDLSSLEKIRELSGTNVPLVFVSNHRSHMDYLILNYLLYIHRIPMPHICTGANLSFWPLGPFFRKTGAFFIRRSFKENRIYTLALNIYIEELIRQKASIEFYIEGTRSRTGKLLPPRMGILSAIVQAYQNGAADEIRLIPISVTYESILEEKNYSDEQAGAVKREETFWDLLKLRKHLTRRKGKVYLRFGNPVSLKGFLQTQGKDISPEERREKVRQVAFDLTYGINKSALVTATSLVAMALLSDQGRSISRRGVEEKVNRYLHYLETKDGTLTEALQKFRKNAIREALKNYVRDRLVEEIWDEEGPLYRIRQGRRPLLDYYKNNSLHFFVSIGVLSTILKAALKTTKGDEIPLQRVEEDYCLLQNLFQYEFTFSQRQSLSSHLKRLLIYLERNGILEEREGEILLLPGSRENLRFFSSPLENFFETYFILWKTLPLMREERWEEGPLLKFLLHRGEILYWKEEIGHPEALSQFTFKNAVWAFRDLGLLDEEREGSGKRKKIFYKRTQSIESIEAGAATGRKICAFMGRGG